MRPVVYFPELRIGEHAVPAHLAFRLTAKREQKTTAAAPREAVAAQASGFLRVVRGRPEMQSCVIEA